MKFKNLFIKINNSKWRKLEETTNIGLIEIRPFPNQIVSSCILSHVLNRLKRISPVVVSNSNSNILEDKDVYNSFSINKFISLKYIIVKNPLIVIRSLYVFIKTVTKFYKSKYDFEDFINSFKLDNVPLGSLVYDSYIRNDLRFIEPKNNLSIFFKILLRAIISFYSTRHLFEKYDVKVVVVSTWFYINLGAFMSRIALSRNIPVFNVNGDLKPMLIEDIDGSLRTPQNVTYKLLSELHYGEDEVKYMDRYLDERFSGNVERFDLINSFAGKEIWDKEKVCKYFGEQVDKNKKFVFVMAHIFSDANHYDGQLLFRDYFSWFSATLEYINTHDIEGVNWFLKKHPSAKEFLEEGLVEKLIAKYPRLKINILPDDFNTVSIFSIADSIVTARGSIAIEAACMGIPTVLAGEAYYSGFGFTIEPTSKDEYYGLLDNISTLKKLNKDEIAMAKKVLYQYTNGFLVKNNIFDRSILAPGKTVEESKNDIDNLYEKLTVNIKDNSYEDDNYYKTVEKIVERFGAVQ